MLHLIQIIKIFGKVWQASLNLLTSQGIQPNKQRRRQVQGRLRIKIQPVQLLR